MGYDQLAESKEDLEKLAKSLRLRIAQKGDQKTALEEELLRVEAKLKKVSEVKT